MAGVVGGDVGRGAFTGEVLASTGAGSPEDPAFIHAHYHFNGRFHSFTADVHVTQILNKAVIIGVVIDGWLEGNLVEGEYTQITCTHDSTSHDRLLPGHTRHSARYQPLSAPASKNCEALRGSRSAIPGSPRIVFG